MKPWQREVVRDLARGAVVAGVVLLVAIMMLSAVTPAYGWSPLPNMTVSIEPSAPQGWVSNITPSDPHYEGKTLVGKAPLLGEWLPAYAALQGLNAFYAVETTGAGYFTGTYYMPTTDRDTWNAAGNWAAVPPHGGSTPNTGNFDKLWATVLRGLQGEAIPAGITFAVAAGQYQVKLNNVNVIVAYPPSAQNMWYDDTWTGADALTAYTSWAADKTVAGGGLGATVAHPEVPFSASSSDVTMTGSWRFNAVVSGSSQAGIYDAAYQTNHKWGRTDGIGNISFGICHEPSFLTSSGHSSGGGYWAWEYGLADLKYDNGTFDGRMTYKRAAIRAWGGTNVDGTYWWTWRVSWKYGNGVGMYQDSYETTGHVASSVSPAVIRVKTDRWYDMGGFFSGTAIESDTNDLIPGASQQIMNIDTLVRVWAGYEKNMVSAPETSTQDAVIGDKSDDPDAKADADPDDQVVGAPNTTSTVSVPNMGWVGVAMGPITRWTQTAYNSVSSQVASGFSAPLGSLLWPFHALDGFK